MISAYKINSQINKGISLGNALEAPTEGDWGVLIKTEFFSKIKSAGFNTVRIPIRWSAHSIPNNNYLINESFSERIDHVINHAIENGLRVIINIHHFEELYASPIKSTEWFLSLWKQITKHYKNSFNEKLIFEILNEPHKKLTSRKWNRLLDLTISEIRKIDSKRFIIIGPARWNNISGLKKLKLPVQRKNIIVTFHYYKPFTFTHQGAHWIKFSKIFLGKKWLGSKKGKFRIEKHFNFVKKWAELNDVPIFLGEFGVYHLADLQSRINWTRFVRQAAEENNFSWCYWEFGAGFGVYDISKNEWRQDLLSSLISKNQISI